MKKIVILTGAGISAESGIQTFRGQNGLWENYRIEEVATPEGFKENPNLVQRFYNERRKQLLSDDIKPNDAHYALAELEHEYEGEVTIITQNIDNLHELGGSENIIHMHGELLKMRCTQSYEVFDIREDITEEMQCSCCDLAGTLRPHIVWFGEMPFYMDEIQKKLESCDIFLSIGTSGQVYPAAMFVQLVKQQDNRLAIEFDIENTSSSIHFDEHKLGKASVEIPKYVANILGKKIH
jgi:NAD-dependent deacetylase